MWCPQDDLMKLDFVALTIIRYGLVEVLVRLEGLKDVEIENKMTLLRMLAFVRHDSRWRRKNTYMLTIYGHVWERLVTTMERMVERESEDEYYRNHSLYGTEKITDRSNFHFRFTNSLLERSKWSHDFLCTLLIGHMRSCDLWEP